jgi:hypothetical protein
MQGTLAFVSATWAVPSVQITCQTVSKPCSLTANPPNASTMFCTLPPNTGNCSLAVTIAGLSSSNSLPLFYAAPVIQSVTPSGGVPTTAGAVFTVFGQNFGIASPSVWVDGVQLSSITSFDELAWNSFRIVAATASAGAPLSNLYTESARFLRCGTL